jgi:hypothetical protein
MSISRENPLFCSLQKTNLGKICTIFKQALRGRIDNLIHLYIYTAFILDGKYNVLCHLLRISEALIQRYCLQRGLIYVHFIRGGQAIFTSENRKSANSWTNLPIANPHFLGEPVRKLQIIKFLQNTEQL